MSAGSRRRTKARARRATRPAAPPDATTRERLIHAARKLLEDGGYAAASVQAIAERAGLAAGAMYRHFPSKAELFVEVFRDAAKRDLAAMGESNLVVERRRGLTRRATLLRAAEIYAERFTLPSGRVVASFEVLFLHGWRPHASQPKPLKPGSASRRLAQALGTSEQSAGEKAGRG